MVGEASIRLDSPTALQQPCFLLSKYKFWIDTDVVRGRAKMSKSGLCCSCEMCSL